MLQESCAQPEVTILHLGGAPVLPKTQRYCYAYSLSRKQDPALRLYHHLSVQFSSVQSHSFRPHGLQHAMPPCPSPTPRVYSNSLDCSLLFLYPTPSLISNYLNLPFGTQGMSKRLNEVCILQTRNRRHRKTPKPHRLLLTLIQGTGQLWLQ